DQALTDLRVAVAGQGAHHDRHWPDHSETHVWPAHPAGGRPLEEVRITPAPHSLACVCVHGIVTITTSQIGKTHQSGNVGIVHKQAVSETVGLINEKLIPL